MKKRRNKAPVTVIILLIVTVIAAALVYRYGILPKKADMTTTVESAVPTETAQKVTVPAPTEPSSAEKESETESESESGNETEKPSGTDILNFENSEGSYEPTAFEAKLFNAVNSKRSENGLSPLKWNDCLHTAAKKRSDETLEKFSHTRPDGRKPSTVLSDSKIEFSLFGECLAKGVKETDEGVTLLLGGFLRDEKQGEALLSADFVYAATAASVDSQGNVNAVILLCNP